jgi:hypothetical protein
MPVAVDLDLVRSSGAIMKMISSTSTTSTSGVVDLGHQSVRLAAATGPLGHGILRSRQAALFAPARW